MEKEKENGGRQEEENRARVSLDLMGIRWGKDGEEGVLHVAVLALRDKAD
jgi:hypothetical protein